VQEELMEDEREFPWKKGKQSGINQVLLANNERSDVEEERQQRQSNETLSN